MIDAIEDTNDLLHERAKRLEQFLSKLPSLPRKQETEVDFQKRKYLKEEVVLITTLGFK